MFGLNRISPVLRHITLPVPEYVPRPWGSPHSVYLIGERSLALVDTGLHCARGSLLAALDELGVAPERIEAILLTGYTPLSLGNVSCFPKARLIGPAVGDYSPVDLRRELHGDLERVVEALRKRECAPAEWSELSLSDAMDTFFAGVPDHVRTEAVSDGRTVAVAEATLELLHVPGVEKAATAYLNGAESQLFGGATLYFEGIPPLRNIRQGISSIDRLSQIRPGLTLPMFGAPEAMWGPAMRGLSLQVHGALTNLPYAFAKDSTAIDLARADVGSYPRDMLRFASHVLWFETLLDELVASGVVEREGDGVDAIVRSGDAQGRRGSRITRDPDVP